MTRFPFILLCAIGVLLTGCVTTDMQGYADRDLPTRPIQRMAAYVVAPTALASSFQSSIAQEAAKRGVGAEDAYALLPPTRTYTDTEIRKVLAESGVDAVLIINVGDAGVVKEYAGTFFQARLVEPATGRNLWVGSGEVSAGGRLFVGNGSSASSSASAIFDDLSAKKII